MSETAAAAEDVAGAGSTLSWRSLRDLYFAPRRFFSRGRQLTDRPEITFVAWVTGVALTLERGDRVRNLADTWVGVWIFALVGGMLTGALRWYVAGWFYGVRLGFCGVDAPDDELVRSVNAWQDFVMTAPQVLWTIVATFIYASYAEAEQSPAMIPLALFIFWSSITSYVGATTAFPKAHRGYAAIWFIVVPLLFFTVFFLF